MTNPETNRPGKRDARSVFRLDRERRRIRIMKFGLALFVILLLLSLIITLVTNQ